MTTASALRGQRRIENQSRQNHATETAKGHDIPLLLESPF